MALKKTLAERLFNLSKISTQALTNCRITSTSAVTRISRNPTQTSIAPDPGDNGNGIFRRFLHKRAIFHPRMSPLGGESLLEKMKTIDIARDRIRLDGLTPPPAEEQKKAEGLTVEETRKLLRAFQLEMVKERLRTIENSWISYSDFIRVCEEACPDPEQGSEFAKLLDESGNVIVLGNTVFLRPEQVTKAIGGLISPGINPNDPRRKELEEMEKQKAEIDHQADALVRRELWCGLGYLVIQTAGFMRLTFWELSWDVMEPICFYVTSMYFMAGYAFFLRTSKEPSFEGFYQSRFNAKLKKLVKVHNFDLERYNQLRQIIHHSGKTSAVSFAHFEKMKIDSNFDN